MGRFIGLDWLREGAQGRINPQDGTVISIVCDMNGGSSGGGWLNGKNGNWYVKYH